MAANKDAAVAFMHLVAAGRVRDAYAQHVGKGFRHHSPSFSAGAENLMKGMEDNARKHPALRLDVLHTIEDGDLVAVHSHVRQTPDDRGAALVHVFRFAGDRIVELWDIGQPVPPDMTNVDGMF